MLYCASAAVLFMCRLRCGSQYAKFTNSTCRCIQGCQSVVLGGAQDPMKATLSVNFAYTFNCEQTWTPCPVLLRVFSTAWSALARRLLDGGT